MGTPRRKRITKPSFTLSSITSLDGKSNARPAKVNHKQSRRARTHAHIHAALLRGEHIAFREKETKTGLSLLLPLLQRRHSFLRGCLAGLFRVSPSLPLSTATTNWSVGPTPAGMGCGARTDPDGVSGAATATFGGRVRPSRLSPGTSAARRRRSRWTTVDAAEDV